MKRKRCVLVVMAFGFMLGLPTLYNLIGSRSFDIVPLNETDAAEIIFGISVLFVAGVIYASASVCHQWGITFLKTWGANAFGASILLALAVGAAQSRGPLHFIEPISFLIGNTIFALGATWLGVWCVRPSPLPQYC